MERFEKYDTWFYSTSREQLNHQTIRSGGDILSKRKRDEHLPIRIRQTNELGTRACAGKVGWLLFLNFLYVIDECKLRTRGWSVTVRILVLDF